MHNYIVIYRCNKLNVHAYFMRCMKYITYEVQIQPLQTLMCTMGDTAAWPSQPLAQILFVPADIVYKLYNAYECRQSIETHIVSYVMYKHSQNSLICTYITLLYMTYI